MYRNWMMMKIQMKISNQISTLKQQETIYKTFFNIETKSHPSAIFNPPMTGKSHSRHTAVEKQF